MPKLSDLSKDKVTVMNRLLDSQNICKALYYTGSDFLDKPDLSRDEKLNLLYNRIFPYKKVPNADSDAGTFITLSFRSYRPVKYAYKSGIVYFNVFTHQDLMETDYEFFRCDFIISEIESLMNDQSGIGIGKTNFFDMDELTVNDKYSGMYIAYKLYEFN